MPHDRFEWLDRIKAVEREYEAMRRAADRFLNEARRDPTILRGDLRARDAQEASDRLEGTYIVRLSAEFETGLRLFWVTVRSTRCATAHLVNSIAGMRGVPDTVRDRVHAVREYRNALVHEREGSGGPVPIRAARSRLCTFFDRLPVKW